MPIRSRVENEPQLTGDGGLAEMSGESWEFVTRKLSPLTQGAHASWGSCLPRSVAGETSAAFLPLQGPQTTRARLQTASQRAESRRPWRESWKTRMSPTRRTPGGGPSACWGTRSSEGSGFPGPGVPGPWAQPRAVAPHWRGGHLGVGAGRVLQGLRSV